VTGEQIHSAACLFCASTTNTIHTLGATLACAEPRMDAASPSRLRFCMRAVVDAVLVIAAVLVLLSLLWR
jgi:hypothetical protein